MSKKPINLTVIRTIDGTANSTGDIPQLREVKIEYEGGRVDCGYALYWKFSNGKQYPTQSMYPAIMSKEAILSVLQNPEWEK